MTDGPEEEASESDVRRHLAEVTQETLAGVSNIRNIKQLDSITSLGV